MLKTINGNFSRGALRKLHEYEYESTDNFPFMSKKRILQRIQSIKTNSFQFMRKNKTQCPIDLKSDFADFNHSLQESKTDLLPKGNKYLSKLEANKQNDTKSLALKDTDYHLFKIHSFTNVGFQQKINSDILHNSSGKNKNKNKSESNNMNANYENSLLTKHSKADLKKKPKLESPNKKILDITNKHHIFLEYASDFPTFYNIITPCIELLNDLSKLLPGLFDLINNYKILLFKLMNNPFNYQKSKFNIALNQNLSQKNNIPKMYDINSANSLIIKSINSKYYSKPSKNQDKRNYLEILPIHFAKSRDNREEEFEKCPLKNQFILNYEQNKKKSAMNFSENKLETIVEIPKPIIEISKISENNKPNS